MMNVHPTSTSSKVTALPLEDVITIETGVVLMGCPASVTVNFPVESTVVLYVLPKAVTEMVEPGVSSPHSKLGWSHSITMLEPQ